MIPVSISAHHVHLTKEDFHALFGANREMTKIGDLSQVGQFVCDEKVTLIGPKGRIERVRVLGPYRPDSQVEVSKTETLKLGIDAPIRASGDIKNTPSIRLEGPAGSVDLKQGVIVALRHIHMEPADGVKFNVMDKDIVSFHISGGDRPLIFEGMLVRIHRDFRLDTHIDTDEANAAGVVGKAQGEILAVLKRQEPDKKKK